MANEKRLIDANRVINEMRMVLDEHQDQKDTVAYYAFLSIIDCLEREPTVDAVEVVHGRWVRCKDWDYDYECSVCEGYAGEDTDGNYNKLTPHCPNCGAKMDGDTK